MPTIDITENDARIQYTANAAQTVFNYDFILFDQDDVVVVVDGVVQTLTTDYMVTGLEVEAGGTIVLTSGATGGEIVTIFRDTAPQRSSQYQADGIFDAAPFERDFDIVTTILQEQKRDISRSVKLDVDSPLVGISLPAASNNAIIAWNSNGTALVNGPSTAAFETATNTAVAAAATATTQAGIATTQAGISTTQAGLSAASALLAEYWSEQAEAFAQAVNLPALGTAYQMLQVNAGGTALAYIDSANILANAAADIPVNSRKITGVADPTNDQDAATKKYVDDNVGGGYPTQGYHPTRYYYGAGFGGSSDGVATTAGRMYAHPFIVGDDVTFTKVGVSVTTSHASSVRLGLYEWENGEPTNLIADYGTVSASTTGEKEISISQALSGGIYALVALVEGTPSIARMETPTGSTLVENLTGSTSSSVSGQTCPVRNSVTWGALPSVFGTPNFYSTGTGVPGVWFRK